MSNRNDNGRWVLPEGWVWTTLGQVACINQRDPGLRNLPDDLEVTFLPMAAVDEIQGQIAEPQLRKLGEVRKGFTSFIEGDVLFAKITPSMENGKAAVARGLRNGIGFGSTEFHVLRPDQSTSPEWLFHYIRQADFREDAKANFSGTAGQLRVGKDFIESYPIPLAPLPDQHHIVAEIEKQFTRLDAAVAALRRAKANLARYKAAVLQAAVEGRLVTARPQRSSETSEVLESASDLLARILAERRARWAAANPKKPYVEPKGPDVAGLPGLPEGWVWASIGQLFDVKVGATPSRAQPAYWGGDIAWVSSGEVSFRRIYATRETITTEGMANSSTRVHPAGTVLLAMIGEGKTRGQAALLETPAANNQNAAAILCADSAVPSPWVFYWLMSRYEETRSGGSGGMQPALNSQLVKAIPIPLAPPSVMKRIVEHIEEKLSIIDSTDRLIDANLTRADRLRQGVLGKAFRGELVANGETSEVF